MAPLSKRLQVALSFLNQATYLADIGCDHGYLPIEAIKSKIVSKAIASDNKIEPYLKAKTNIELENLSHLIKAKHQDGIVNLPTTVDAISILGMGGEVMVQILENGCLENIKILVLGPNSEAKQVRYFLENNHFKIDDEAFIQDHGHYYQIIRAIKGEMHLTPLEAAYGPLNIQRQTKELLAFVNHEITKLTKSLEHASEASKLEIITKINEMRGVFNELN